MKFLEDNNAEEQSIMEYKINNGVIVLANV